MFDFGSEIGSTQPFQTHSLVLHDKRLARMPKAPVSSLLRQVVSLRRRRWLIGSFFLYRQLQLRRLYANSVEMVNQWGFGGQGDSFCRSIVQKWMLSDLANDLLEKCAPLEVPG